MPNEVFTNFVRNITITTMGKFIKGHFTSENMKLFTFSYDQVIILFTTFSLERITFEIFKMVQVKNNS